MRVRVENDANKGPIPPGNYTINPSEISPAGYILGFHILGILYFPGLLKDFDGWSMDYLQSALAVTATLFAIYVITVLVLFLIKNFFTKKNR